MWLIGLLICPGIGAFDLHEIQNRSCHVGALCVYAAIYIAMLFRTQSRGTIQNNRMLIHCLHSNDTCHM